MSKLRFTVKTRIYAGLTAIILFGVLSMLYIYQGLGAVTKNLNRLDEVEVPFSTAAFEMEVNSEEYALEVLKYLARPDPAHRAEAADDAADFERGYAEYLRLSTVKQRRKLGLDLGQEHPKLVAMGEALMQKKDEQDAAFAHVAGLLEKIDDLVDAPMPAGAQHAEPLRSKILAAIANVEAETAEIGFWLAAYQRRPTAETRRSLSEKIAEHASALASYRSLPLGAEARRRSTEIETIYVAVVASIDGLLAIEDSIAGLVERFIAKQDQIDDVVDDRIQTLALKRLAEPREKADKATEAVLGTLRYLIPLYVLVAMIGGAALIWTIVRPLRRLALGTTAIGRGDSAHRVEEQGRDEFEDLATQFNRMVIQLEQTTVSKRLLESSDQALRETVNRLQEQIAERERAEREQEKLRAELRRSESLAVMGSLMAGVAHEVRNPLFGISSTLDAMEAKPGADGRDDRYRQVLRREVERLNKLMHDLLEYGRPPTDHFVSGSLHRVVADAARICSARADARAVSIVNGVPADLAALRMNPTRLSQVFVNLIDNAVQHAPPGTEVIANAAALTEGAATWVECTVEDSGPGFDPEHLPLIFDPFFTRRRKGTGLGLSIVQRIVDEHGGRIVAANRAAGGAIMTVCLPMMRATDPDDAAPDS